MKKKIYFLILAIFVVIIGTLLNSSIARVDIVSSLHLTNIQALSQETGTLTNCDTWTSTTYDETPSGYAYGKTITYSCGPGNLTYCKVGYEMYSHTNSTVDWTLVTVNTSTTNCFKYN
jgi:hypothetical protein